MEETKKIFNEIVDNKQFDSVDVSKLKEEFDFAQINSATSTQLENLKEFVTNSLSEEQRVDFIYEILCSPDISEENYQSDGILHPFLNQFKSEIDKISANIESDYDASEEAAK
jgi:hypothetical protein